MTTTLRGRFVRLTVPSNLLGRRVRVTVTGTTGKVFTKVLQADAVSLFVPVDDFSPAPAESESLTSAKSEVLP